MTGNATILGEYLERMFDEIKNRPLHFVRDRFDFEAVEVQYAEER